MISGNTFYKLAADAATQFGNREFLSDGYTRMSFAELHERGKAAARWMHSLGLRRGDTVVTCVPNWNEFVVLYVAVSACGAILAPCPIDIGAIRLRETIDLLNPSVLIVSWADHVDAALDAGFKDSLIDVRLNDSRCRHYEDVFQVDYFMGQESSFKPVLQTDISTILFTSGSTGTPKGVLNTAYAHEYVASQIATGLKPTVNDVFFTPIAFCHIFGLCNGLLLALMNGSRLVLCDRYTVEGAIELIVKEGCTVHLGVPTMFIRELKKSEGRLEGSQLRAGIIGGSPPPEGLIETFEKVTGCRLLPSFGMTETTGGVTLTAIDAPAQKRYTAEGKAILGAQVGIIDKQGNRLSPGEQGQLVVKTPGMMAGYYNGGVIAANQEVMENWFETGDLGYLDEDGYLFVTGRIKDIIIRGGTNVFPNEVESIYYRRNDILDACLVGYPDEELGERTCLFVVFASDTEVSTSKELRDYAKSLIEREKVPDRVVVIESMPRLSASKIDKKALAALAKEQAFK